MNARVVSIGWLCLTLGIAVGGLWATQIQSSSDPRAQAMLAAGYRPVSVGQVVLDARDVTPVDLRGAERETRVQVLQAIRWSNAATGGQVRTSQVHEAVIRGTASYY